MKKEIWHFGIAGRGIACGDGRAKRATDYPEHVTCKRCLRVHQSEVDALERWQQLVAAAEQIQRAHNEQKRIAATEQNRALMNEVRAIALPGIH